MPLLLCCPRWHFWEADSAEAARCPACGEPAESLPLLDLLPEPAVPAVAAAEPPPLLDRDGRPVVEGYTIREDLGATPAGTRRFRAEQTAARRDVLLSVVLARDDPTQKAWGELRGEAAALARVSHACFPVLYDAGQRDRQLFFNATSATGGIALVTFLAGLKRPLPPSQALRLVEVLARALVAAHEEGVLHRHLHPGCIALRPAAGGAGAEEVSSVCQLGDGYFVPQVRGLGLARRAADPGPFDVELYEGEPGYLSPEQAWGRAGDLGTHTDVYGLGGVLYFLLTGRAPYGGPTVAEVLDAIEAGRLDAPSRYRNPPRDLEAICVRALSRRVTRRYRTAGEMADDLRRARLGLPLGDGADGGWWRLGKWCRRQPSWATLLVLMLFAALGMWVAYHAGGSAAEGDSYAYHAAVTKRTLATAERTIARLNAEVEALGEAERFANYRHVVWRAAAALEAKDIPAAADRLKECDEKQRRFEWHYLKKGINGGEAPWVKPVRGAVRSVARSSKEGVGIAALVVDGGRDVRLWSPDEGANALKLDDVRVPIQLARYSPDGEKLAVAGADGGGSEVLLYNHASMWSRRRPELLCQVRLPNERITDLAFHPDGESFLVVTNLGNLTRHATADGSVISNTATVAFTRPANHRLAVRRDGESVAVFVPGEDDVWVSSIENLTMAGETLGRPRVTAVTYDGDGLLALGRMERVVSFHGPSGDSEWKSILELPGVPRQLAFSPDGKRLAVACEGGKVIIYGRGHTAWAELVTLDADGTVGLAFTASGRGLLTAGRAAVKAWGDLKE